MSAWTSAKIAKEDRGYLFDLAQKLAEDPFVSHLAISRFLQAHAMKFLHAKPHQIKAKLKDFDELSLAACEKIDRYYHNERGRRIANFFAYHPGNLRASFEAMLEVSDYQVCFNEFDEVFEIRHGDDGQWEDLEYSRYAELRTELPGVTRPQPVEVIKDRAFDGLGYHKQFIDKNHLKIGWQLKADEWKSHQEGVAFANSRNPIKEKLDEIVAKHRNRFGVDITGEKLKTEWKKWFRCKPGYEKAASYMLAMILCGIVNRAYNPGCRHSWTPALIGGNGIGKGALIENIVWDKGKQVYSDFSFPKNSKGAEQTTAYGQQFVGNLIIVLDEMGAFNMADKNIVTRVMDSSSVSFRRVWKKSIKRPYLHRHAFVILYNRNDVIVMTPGVENRRVLPICLLRLNDADTNDQCGQRIEDTWTEEYRELMFAEAYYLCQEKPELWMQMKKEIEAEMIRLTPDHVRVNELADYYVREALNDFSSDDLKNGVTQAQVKEHLSMKAPQNLNIPTALRTLHFADPQKTRVGGVGGYYWKATDKTFKELSLAPPSSTEAPPQQSSPEKAGA